ncbi:MAG: hypothetical protein GF320_21475 [Armatimonadia bacterium]|nr:hypothetical protein [Armatimonadia bacterium]
MLEEETTYNVPVAAVALMCLAVVVLILKGCWGVAQEARGGAPDGHVAMVSDPSPE